jgi:hypothetical protein
LQEFLFKKAIKRGHQGSVSDALVESSEDVAHAHFTNSPGLLKDLTLQRPEGQAGNLPGSTETAQKESGGFHVADC